MTKPQVLVVAGVLAAHALLLVAVHRASAQRAEPVQQRVVSISVVPNRARPAPPPPTSLQPAPQTRPRPSLPVPTQAPPPAALQAVKPGALAPSPQRAGAPQPAPVTGAAALVGMAAAPGVAVVAPAGAAAAPAVATAPAGGVPSTPPPPLAVAGGSAAVTAPDAASAHAKANPDPQAAPFAGKVDLPSSTADYLNNPQPVYPPLSERRREHGRVLLTVVVDAQGRPRSVQIKSSSGFDRLDQAALKTVANWTFVPGKRDGKPVEMAVDVPIRFQLPP